MKKSFKWLAAATALTASASIGWAQTQGVTDDEIVIGSVNDLSGIFAAVGVPATKGANVVFDRVNEAGGIHGRKIRYVVEDNGYQMPRAMQGYNKLLNRDKVFAMLQSLGTPMNMAGFKLLDPKGIPNVAPLTAARQMLQEPMRNKFTSFSTYYDQARVGVKYLAGEFGSKTVCTMYLPTDFGEEILEGSKAGAEEAGIAFGSETTHKPDETDFVGSLSKLKEEGCDIVTMALGVRQAITVVGTAKKMGLTDMKFLGTSASFLTVVAQVPGGVTDGFYAAASWQDLWARADQPAPAAFIEEYKAATGEDPVGFAMLGYSAAEMMVKALEAAGPDLTHDSFIEAMESLDYQDDLVGNHITYGPDDHQGADTVFVNVVENGAWKLVYEE
ncbi:MULTISPECIES: ABC transporter substrate-binding protein [unclassified Ruegeria]|jgi:branched-chain amino acid transport system substrate-binding protein|uniref:ABC transporter substrate-binding protein n=1 Tax=unclassified Ruegeria TaxID=2625375 RepID=UPI0012686116|nr:MULTISPECIES: ABC transporter substrate-binding protein [unclassified Ruegeria]NOC44719.1 ABC transporter substrate-binding protein [Ruegeria sp. HKCCD7559]NOD83445.1 ABC transporter substrate-binding protein [Ruegeria sp. HKCCD6119]QFT72856.1 Leucine-, isoleucine-, valine-, threonine-, and alanine-binding protein precursor [Ruegeria sp. THAF33]